MLTRRSCHSTETWHQWLPPLLAWTFTFATILDVRQFSLRTYSWKKETIFQKYCVNYHCCLQSSSWSSLFIIITIIIKISSYLNIITHNSAHDEKTIIMNKAIYRFEKHKQKLGKKAKQHILTHIRSINNDLDL